MSFNKQSNPEYATPNNTKSQSSNLFNTERKDFNKTNIKERKIFQYSAQVPKPLNQLIEMKSEEGIYKFNLYHDKQLGFGKLQKYLIERDVDEDTKTTDEVAKMGVDKCIQDFQIALDIHMAQNQSKFDSTIASKAKSSYW